MSKILLLKPEEPTPDSQAEATSALGDRALKLGILDNGKSNADHLLRMVVDGLKAALPIASVTWLRKASASLKATPETLDQLTRECNFVLTAMAD